MERITNMSKYYTVTTTLPNGKRKYYRGKTRKEAEDKREKDLIAIGKGVKIGDDTTFRELANVWYAIKCDKNLHTASLDSIEQNMKLHVLPILGGMKIVDIKPYHIRMLMHAKAGFSNSLQSKVMQITKGVLELAVENELIPSNPCLKSIKAEGKKPQEVVPLTDQQCRVLLEATKGTKVWLFVMTLLYAGLRRGEALGLMWKDIDFDAGTLTVNRSIVYPSTNAIGEINTDCKTSAAHRTIPLVSVLKSALLEAKGKSRSLYVFSGADGKFLTKSGFESMWNVITTHSVFNTSKKPRHDVPIDFHVHPHQLRHTCATAWIRSGLDPRQVMYLMGHASMDVTMEIYTHYEEELRRSEAVEKMELRVVAR